jgi:hypothetical protein
MHEQPMAEPPYGHGGFVHPMFNDRSRRRITQEIESVAREYQRRLLIEKFYVGDGNLFTTRHGELVRKGKFFVAVFQMRIERSDLPVKLERLVVGDEFKAMRVTPTASVPRR